MNRLFKILIAVSVLALATSCGKDIYETNEETQDRVLEAWVKYNYPDKVSNKTESGAYILEFDQGTGDLVSDTGFVFTHYVRRDLSGNITSTNREEFAKQLGTHVLTDYYGPDIWQMGMSAIYAGVEEALVKLRVGGHVKLAVPISATTATYNSYNAFPGSESAGFIIDIDLERVEKDIYVYQKKCLQAYSDTYYGGLDSTMEGFYFKRHTIEGSEIDSIPYDQNVDVWYIGRRLDGSVFDTNIEDTAKKYRIYNSSKEYTGLDAKRIDPNSMSSEDSETSDLVDGFQYAVNRMHYGDTCTTFFWSKLGYGMVGTGTSIGEYSPLCFYIMIDTKDKN